MADLLGYGFAWEESQGTREIDKKIEEDKGIGLLIMVV